MRRVAVVPHTHWDREWYEPFQSFRFRLVELLDELLDLLESDPSYARFLLDGQLAVVDDYLEVRPEAEGRIRALVAAGRLSVGPWYVLLDEFLVSQETIVRDLELGLRRGAAFGGASPIGYLPDMFGHVAQMPQILRLAGFEHAVVWRGVPSAIEATGFWWEAPDGSRVRAEYLPVGYANGAALPDDAKAVVRRIADHEEELSRFLIGPMLLMNGADHLRPQRRLGQLVEEANALQGDYRLEITSLPEYLDTAPREGLSTWRGELRSGSRANVLMGVSSNRVDVKVAAARAERAVERRAEPLAALFLPAAQWPERLLDIAWLELVRNAAHDSVCACSVDDVVDAVLVRYAEARQIGEAVATDALHHLGRSMADHGPVVANPLHRTRSGVVELSVVAKQAEPGDLQVVSERLALPSDMTIDATTARTLLGLMQGPRLDGDTFVQRISIDEEGDGLHVDAAIGPEEVPVPIAEAKQDLYTRLGARPDASVHVHLDQPAIRRVVARVENVPGFGWRRFEAATLEHPVTVGRSDGTSVNPPPGALVLDNGLTNVVIDPADGTFAVDGIGGFGRMVDGGDHGDSYNYSPPRTDTLVSRPVAVDLAIEEAGPVRGRAVVRGRYRWPERLDEGSSTRVGDQIVEIETRLELQADERALRVSHAFVNPSRDHRLRAHLPLPTPTARSEADTAFATVRRGLEAEGRPDELGLATYPARRFVVAGGLTVCLDGLREYELVDLEEGHDGPVARTLALTLLRATGMLSRLGMAYRPLPAGPRTPVEGLQLTGERVEARYALCLGPVDPWALSDEVLLPLEVVASAGGGQEGPVGSALSVSGAEVSAVRRVRGALEVRVFNPSPTETEVEVGSRAGWVVDLAGRPERSFAGSFALRPWGIATLRLAEG